MNNRIDFSVFINLRYQQHLVCDQENIIILDVPCPDWFKKELILLPSKRKIVLIEGNQLSKELAKMIKKETLFNQDDNQQNTLLVFPGNGACFVKNSLPKEILGRFSQTNVFAKRGWYDNKDPLVIVGEINPDHLLMLNIKKVVVIDDVISSGNTMRKLYNRNYWKFPRADWFATSWIMQYPRVKVSSGIKGFEETITTSLVEGNQGQRVPINSLSTLLQCPAIAKEYATKCFRNPVVFLKILSEF